MSTIRVERCAQNYCPASVADGQAGDFRLCVFDGRVFRFQWQYSQPFPHWCPLRKEPITVELSK